MTSVLKNVYLDKLDDTVYVKKSVYVKSNTYIDSSKETNNEDPKFIVDDIVRISKYEHIFAKG